VYVGKEAFQVETGECIFLPKLQPHAFVIRSSRLCVLALFSPAGLEDAFRSMSSPAQNMELPPGALTYSTADPNDTAKRFSEYGIHLLAPDEIADWLPLYPRSLPRDHGKGFRKWQRFLHQPVPFLCGTFCGRWRASRTSFELRTRRPRGCGRGSMPSASGTESGGTRHE
jgi:hypothetical protein